MTTKTTVTAHVVDICYPDYLTDHTGILVGAQRAGQTVDHLVDDLTDEAYQNTDEYGDLVHTRIHDAIETAVSEYLCRCGHGPYFRLWPVDESGIEITDESGIEITDPDVEVPEQPSLWVRVEIATEALSIRLDNMDRHDGMVMVWCDDGDDALADQSIEGSHWERIDDTAYTSILDCPDLVERLTAQGYDVDTSEYAAPTEGTMRALEAISESETTNQIVWRDYDAAIADALADLADDSVTTATGEIDAPIQVREYWGENGPSGWSARGWRVHLRGNA